MLPLSAAINRIWQRLIRMARSGPGEAMTMVSYRNQKFTTEKLKKGKHTIEVPEDEVVFFIRHDHCIIIGREALNTAEADLKNVELLGDGKSYLQYLE